MGTGMMCEKWQTLGHRPVDSSSGDTHTDVSSHCDSLTQQPNISLLFTYDIPFQQFNITCTENRTTMLRVWTKIFVGIVQIITILK